MILLERNGCVDRDRGRTRSSLGVHEGEHPRPAGGIHSTCVRGGETHQGVLQGSGITHSFQVFAGARAHHRNNTLGVVQFTHGKDAKVVSIGFEQFNKTGAPLSVLRIDIHQDNFGAQVLDLAQNRVSRGRSETGMAENGTAQSRAFHTMLQHHKAVSVFG